MGLSIEHPSGSYMEELLVICNPVLMKTKASNPFNYAESLNTASIQASLSPT